MSTTLTATRPFGLILWATLLVAQQPARSDAGRPPSQRSNGLLEIAVTPAVGRAPGSLQHDTKDDSITITLKNIAPTMITLGNSRVECDFVVEVVDSAGRPATKTERGLRLPESEEDRNCESVSYHVVKLEVGQALSWTWDLTTYFALDPHQAYTVTVRRSRGLPKTDTGGKPINSRLTHNLKLEPTGTRR